MANPVFRFTPLAAPTPSTPTDPYTNQCRDYNVEPVLADGIEDLAWSPTANVLAAGGRDGSVRCWEVWQRESLWDSRDKFKAILMAQIEHDGPVLCIAFSPDGSTLFSGSCDKTVKRWVLGAAEKGDPIATHAGPVLAVRTLEFGNCVVTGSSDLTIKYWDTRSPTTAVATTQLPAGLSAMDAKDWVVAAATTNKRIHLYDIRKHTQPYQSIEPSYAAETRTITLMTKAVGLFAGSMDGHCMVQYFEPGNKVHNQTFNCGQNVTSISLNPAGVFSTTGSDGVYRFWRDKTDKFNAPQNDKTLTSSPTNQSISVGCFNTKGDIFAYALSLFQPNRTHTSNVMLQPSVIRLRAVSLLDLSADFAY